MRFFNWLVALFFSLFNLFGIGCVSLPSKDANLTDVYKPIPSGASEISVPATMLGGPEGTTFSYKGDSNKNISFSKREWHENGTLKSEIIAGGDRSGTIESTTAGLSSIESNRIGARLQQLEMTIAVFERTLDKALSIVSARMTASASAPVEDSSKIDKLIGLFEKLQPLLEKGNAKPN